jgi:hypothetical protein
MNHLHLKSYNTLGIFCGESSRIFGRLPPLHDFRLDNLDTSSALPSYQAKVYDRWAGMLRIVELHEATHCDLTISPGGASSFIDSNIIHFAGPRRKHHEG